MVTFSLDLTCGYLLTDMSNRSLRSAGRPFSANRTHTSQPKTAADGRKYPEIKQRGFYSDIVGPGADQRLGVRI